MFLSITVAISVSSLTDILLTLIQDVLPFAREEILSKSFATAPFRVARLPAEALSLLSLLITIALQLIKRM